MHKGAADRRLSLSLRERERERDRESETEKVNGLELWV